MATTELRIELPITLSQEEAKLLLAIKLFEVGKASLGQAAKTAELSKRTFMETLGRCGVPVFNYSSEELRTEVDRLKMFDQATQRQRDREKREKFASAVDRGWKREDLYDRGRPD